MPRASCREQAAEDAEASGCVEDADASGPVARGRRSIWGAFALRSVLAPTVPCSLPWRAQSPPRSAHSFAEAGRTAPAHQIPAKALASALPRASWESPPSAGPPYAGVGVENGSSVRISAFAVRPSAPPKRRPPCSRGASRCAGKRGKTRSANSAAAGLRRSAQRG